MADNITENFVSSTVPSNQESYINFQSKVVPVLNNVGINAFLTSVSEIESPVSIKIAPPKTGFLNIDLPGRETDLDLIASDGQENGTSRDKEAERISYKATSQPHYVAFVKIEKDKSVEISLMTRSGKEIKETIERDYKDTGWEVKTENS